MLRQPGAATLQPPAAAPLVAAPGWRAGHCAAATSCSSSQSSSRTTGAAHGAPPPGWRGKQAAACGAQICSAAAMGCASESTSKGARSVTAATVAGHESVIQKYLH